ncbi:MAG: hypothetical protein P4L83_21765, partial [Nevskia sp.]|nr:hypothetical protein [Nevskia sp.]
DFNTSAAGVISLSTLANAPDVQLCVRNLSIRFHQPQDLVTTTTVATAAAGTTITVASASGIVVGDYVVDATNWAALSNWANISATPLTTVTQIAGNVITLSNAVLSTGVASGDTIDFAQPRANFTTLAQGCSLAPGAPGCKYPWAIYNNGSQTASVNHVLIEGAWDGMYQRGQTYNINDLYVGALDQGLNEDNGHNFPQIDNYEAWNFGFGNGVNATGHSAFSNNYYDGNTVCANLGASDGLAAGKMQCWSSSLNLTSNWSWGHFANLMMDGSGANFNVSNTSGWTQIANFYSTKGASAVTPITVSSGQVYIGSAAIFDSENFSPTAGDILVSGGGLHIYGGWMVAGSETAIISPAVVTAGTLEFSHVKLDNVGSCGNSAWGGYVSQSGTGVVKITDNEFTTSCAASGKIAVKIGADNASNQVVGNILNSWGFTAPGTLGMYGPNSSGPFTITGMMTASSLAIPTDSSATGLPAINVGTGGNNVNYGSFSGGRALFGYDGNGPDITAGAGKGFQVFVNGTNGTLASGTLALGISSAGAVTAPVSLGVTADSQTTAGITVGSGASSSNYMAFSGGRAMFGMDGGGYANVTAGLGKGFEVYVNGTNGSLVTGTEALSITSAGAATFGGTVTAPRLITTPATPASSSAACTIGQIAVDASYVYVCTATNTWKRAALASW